MIAFCVNVYETLGSGEAVESGGASEPLPSKQASPGLQVEI